MLGGLSLKWNWRRRPEAAGQINNKPEPGASAGDVRRCGRSSAATSMSSHGLCRSARANTMAIDDVSLHIDENTIGVAAVLGTTFTGTQGRHRRVSTTCCSKSSRSAALMSRCMWTAPAAVSCGPSSIPTEWDSASSRCARSTSPDTSSGPSSQGIGWLIFREKSDLAIRPGV